MIVRFSPKARRRVQNVSEYWRTNRPAAPTLFDDELHDLVERLKDQPTLGLEYEVRGKIVRRVLLPKSAQHVYYAVDDVHGVIVIYTVWGARRGREPTL